MAEYVNGTVYIPKDGMVAVYDKNVDIEEMIKNVWKFGTIDRVVFKNVELLNNVILSAKNTKIMVTGALILHEGSRIDAIEIDTTPSCIPPIHISNSGKIEYGGVRKVHF